MDGNQVGADSMNNTNSIGIENMNEIDESMPRSNQSTGAPKSKDHLPKHQQPLLDQQTIHQVQHQNQFTSLQKFKSHKKTAESIDNQQYWVIQNTNNSKIKKQMQITNNVRSTDKLGTRKHQ